MCAAAANDMTSVLKRLYDRQLAAVTDSRYLREHGAPAFLNGTIQTFRFYVPYLPASGRILDWGCHHAPDACLIRLHLGDRVDLDGCDVYGTDQFRVFHEFAGLRYEQLQDAVRLPYPDASFDTVVSSGVLEHVPFDYESLKELHRVLKPAGRLIVTYLPNTTSIAEWWLRSTKRPAHLRRYSRSQIRSLLLHSGFRPLFIGFQDRMDLLPANGGSYPVNGVAFRALRPVLRVLSLERLSSCLCAVAYRVASF
jgi:SAM-dependent methyltransferase